MLISVCVNACAWLHIYKQCNVAELIYLHSVNVRPAHATAAVNEEYELAVDFPQVRADRLEVRAEVDHDHGVVEDVFMESSVNDIYLMKDQEKEGLWLTKRT